MSNDLSNFINRKQFKKNFNYGIDFESMEDGTENKVKDKEQNGHKRPRIHVSNTHQFKSLFENCDGEIHFSKCIFNL